MSDLGKVLAWPDLEIAAVGECFYRTRARARSLARASLVYLPWIFDRIIKTLNSFSIMHCKRF